MFPLLWERVRERANRNVQPSPQPSPKGRGSKIAAHKKHFQAA
ncbi:hypothetical protein [Alysiella filiformis]|nr:hypothetical protein [Alysiella filiformis]